MKYRYPGHAQLQAAPGDAGRPNPGHHAGCGRRRGGPLWLRLSLELDLACAIRKSYEPSYELGESKSDEALSILPGYT